MKDRTNVHFSYIVNRGLIMCKFKGVEETTQMMAKAGLPKHVIERVLHQSHNVRGSDWR